MPGQDVKGAGRLLVVGGGYTGRRFARAALRQAMPVLLTSRQPRPPEAGGAPPAELKWLLFDSGAAALPPASALAGVTHVLVTAPPDGGPGDPTLRCLGPLLRELPLQWLGYLSTTGVYGDTGGAWVEESAPPRPGPGRSQARLEAEQAWRESGLPVQVLRLPAIYGPGRSPFAGLRGGRSRLIHKPGQVFSRVHVDDIVGALLHCLSLPAGRRPAVLNITDDRPCPSSELLGFACHLLGLKLPDAERYADIEAELSPMARSFWAENRRASNRLLCRELGYRLRYPSFREGLPACLAEEEAPADGLLGGGSPAGGQSQGSGSATKGSPRS
ncbi:SDR family oxidoreductase [Cyanobium sp. CH-040]|uniref:SDR family oxidoreductase n=1 Tax=Cyanobium sp. CH-040 TaxID=2823708 RepID=UPI0020CF724D|nr:SDR family oxidoreductase [Cyanobium sp. CH-040]